ncbi:TonB-dependent receptor [Flavivirga eckloniae]|nr:TonB-dependent receptor [Flavivirga eckloniae]
MKIVGVVKNSSNAAIEFANVVLTSPDGKIIAGSVTDATGGFVLSVKQGNYKLVISFIGYEDWIKNISVNTNKNLETITLIESKNELDEVEVVAKKRLFERKIDRLVFNVENSSSNNGDILNALKVTPGVRVLENGISIIGRDQVRVLIDGKFLELTREDLVNYLRSIPAGDIASIEVITSPPAKYQAEGNSGFINIVYKKNKSNSWKNNIFTAYTQKSYPTLYLGNTFSLKKNKLQLYANVGLNKGNSAVESTSDIYYEDFENKSRRKFKNETDFLSSRFSLDYDFSSKTSIGIIAQHYTIPQNSRDNEILNITNNNTIRERFITRANSDQKSKIASYNLHLIQKLDTLGRQFSIDVDYFDFNKDRERYFFTNQVNGSDELINNFEALNYGKQDIENYSFKIDFEYPTKFVNISLGSRISFTNITSDTKLFNIENGENILDTENSNVFNFEEDIQGVYIDFYKKINEKWQAKLGARLENTETRGELITNETVNRNSYLKLFPTAFIQYNIKENRSLNFSYNKRLNRPKYWELNPFKWFRNPNSYSEGNPFLLPAITDNFNLRYTINKNLTVSSSFSTTDQGSGQITLLNEGDINQIYTRDNYYKSDTYRAQVSYDYRKIKWWDSHFQTSVFHTDVKVRPLYRNIVNVNNGTGVYFSTNNTFSLWNNLKFDLSFWYSAPNKVFFEKREAKSLDFGINFSFLGEKLQCNINAYDILKTSNRDIIVYTKNIRQVYNDYYDNRHFVLSLRYSFGNKKVNVKSKDFGNDEEKNRVD